MEQIRGNKSYFNFAESSISRSNYLFPLNTLEKSELLTLKKYIIEKCMYTYMYTCIHVYMYTLSTETINSWVSIVKNLAHV